MNLINFVYLLEPVWNRSFQTASEHAPILNSQPKPRWPVLKENWVVTWSQNIPCLLSRHPSSRKTSPFQCLLPRIKTSVLTMTLQGWMQQHHLVMAASNLLTQQAGLYGFSFPQRELGDGAPDMVSWFILCPQVFREAELFLVLPAKLHGFLSSWPMTHSCSRNCLRRVNRSPDVVPEQQPGGWHLTATNTK